MAFTPPDPSREVKRGRHHLPHWKQDGATMFITFRLGDSIPQEKLHLWVAEREQWLTYHGVARAADLAELPDELRQEYHRQFTVRFHDWLDAGSGECLLRLPDVGQITAGALHYFDGERYAMEAYVIMPNHVHVLFTPYPGVDFSEILHTWKSYTVHEINAELQRRGNLWQKESYNHIVRDEAEFHRYRRYIRSNPTRAKLTEEQFIWWDVLGEP